MDHPLSPPITLVQQLVNSPLNTQNQTDNVNEVPQNVQANTHKENEPDQSVLRNPTSNEVTAPGKKKKNKNKYFDCSFYCTVCNAGFAGVNKKRDVARMCFTCKNDVMPTEQIKRINVKPNPVNLVGVTSASEQEVISQTNPVVNANVNEITSQGKKNKKKKYDCRFYCEYCDYVFTRVNGTRHAARMCDRCSTVIDSFEQTRRSNNDVNEGIITPLELPNGTDERKKKKKKYDCLFYCEYCDHVFTRVNKKGNAPRMCDICSDTINPLATCRIISLPELPQGSDREKKNSKPVVKTEFKLAAPQKSKSAKENTKSNVQNTERKSANPPRGKKKTQNFTLKGYYCCKRCSTTFTSVSTVQCAETACYKCGSMNRPYKQLRPEEVQNAVSRGRGNGNRKKLYGYFMCKKCNKFWESGHSMEGYRQQCKRCFRFIVPYRLENKKYGLRSGPRMPHEWMFCEMCQELYPLRCDM